LTTFFPVLQLQIGMDHSEILQMFSLLKQSIDNFYSKNIHLENSGVFSMTEIIRNCNKLEAYLNSDYKVLWQMERQEVKDLRERLETVPVEIVHMPPEEFDTMPPLERDVLDSEFDDMPPLVSEFDDMPPLEAFVPPVEKFVLPENNELNTAFCKYSTSPPVWAWPSSSASVFSFNQQIRDL